MNRVARWLSGVVGCTVLVGAPMAAHGVVNTIDAFVTARVEEVVDGTVVNVEQAFQSLDETTGNLPLVADVDIFRLEDGEEASAAAARMTFQDPRLSLLPNPAEFGVDVAAFSRLAGIAYRAQADSTEERAITFTSQEIGAAPGTLLQARSRFFVDGVILVWGEAGATNLEGTIAEIELTVDQTRQGASGATRVLQAELSLIGRSDGGVDLVVEGDLSEDNVVLVDLTGRIDELGAAYLLIIPATSIPYDYAAEVDETFELMAGVRGTVANQPGTGASIVLGLPLASLLALINEVTAGGVAATLDGLLNQTLSSSPPPVQPLTPAGTGETEVTIISGPRAIGSILSGGICGLLGAESAMMLTVLGAGFMLSSRTGRRRSSSSGR